MMALVMCDSTVRLIYGERIGQLIAGACGRAETELGEISLIGIVTVNDLLDLTVLGRIYGQAAVIELLLRLIVRLAELFLHIRADLLHQLIGEIRESSGGCGLLFHIVGRDPGINVIGNGLVVLLLRAPAHLQHIIET